MKSWMIQMAVAVFLLSALGVRARAEPSLAAYAAGLAEESNYNMSMLGLTIQDALLNEINPYYYNQSALMAPTSGNLTNYYWQLQATRHYQQAILYRQVEAYRQMLRYRQQRTIWGR